MISRPTDVLWLAAGVAMVIVFVGLWALLAQSGNIPGIFLPTPQAVWDALITGVEANTLPPRILETLQRMLVGWLLASLVAIVVGALISASPWLERHVTPTLEFLRPLPASATVPLFIGLFGLTDIMVLVAIIFGAVWPPLLATINGFRTVDPRLYDVAAALQLSRFTLITKIALPSALPEIIAGLRLSLTVALMLTIVCEMLATAGGLGEWILSAGRLFDAANLYAGVAILGLIGLLTNAMLSMIENRLLRWQ